MKIYENHQTVKYPLQIFGTYHKNIYVWELISSMLASINLNF